MAYSCSNLAYTEYPMPLYNPMAEHTIEEHKLEKLPGWYAPALVAAHSQERSKSETLSTLNNCKLDDVQLESTSDGSIEKEEETKQNRKKSREAYQRRHLARFSITYPGVEGATGGRAARSSISPKPESVYSTKSSEPSFHLPQNHQRVVIAFFVDALIEQSGARQRAGYALATQPQELIVARLNHLLGSYTYELVSQSIASWISRNSHSTTLSRISLKSRLLVAANLIRDYRSEITQNFYKNLVPLSTNSLPLAERLKTLGQQLSLSERFNLLAKSEPQTPGSGKTAQDLSTKQEPVDLDDVNLVAGKCRISSIFMRHVLEAKIFRFFGLLTSYHDLMHYLLVAYDKKTSN